MFSNKFGFFYKIKNIFSVLIAVVASVFLVSLFVFAASTIDLNISTGGYLAISGTSATSTFSTGGLTVGTSQFVVQQTTGKVGIGTTTPFNMLHIYSNSEPALRVESGSSVTEASIIIKGVSDTSSPVSLFFLEGGGTGPSPNGSWELGYLAAADYFYIAGGNSPTEKMVITDSGNFGIGTTSPYAKFSINGKTVFGNFDATNTSATSNISGNLTVGGVLSVSGTSTLAGVSSGYLTSSNNLQAAGILKITGSGTSTVAGNFEVTGNLLAEGGQRVCTSGNSICTGAGTINSGTTNRLSYYSGATTLDSADFLTVDITSSRLGIGTSTPYASLSVVGKAVFDSFTATSTSATSTIGGGLSVSGVLGIGTSSPWATRLSITGVGASSDRGFVFADSGNATKFVIQNDGRVGIGTTTPAKEFGLVGDSYQSSNATTTLYIKSTDATKGGCIELEDPTGLTYRIYIDVSGSSTLRTEVGTCK